MKRISLWIVLLGWAMAPTAPAWGEGKTGFLVIAPDRGFLGNQEVDALFDAFKKEYPAALARVGRDYQETERGYAAYLRQAVSVLQTDGASEIVALPLFFSASDPTLKKAMPHLSHYFSGKPIRWAPAMSESYLASQILLDRVDALSQNASEERLVVVGIGAADEESERAMRAEMERHLQYVLRYRPFREARVGVYYDRDVRSDLRESKNKGVDDQIIQMAARRGRMLLVPFFIGPKFDGQMVLTRWVGSKFEEMNVVYNAEEIFPHPNLLLWMKKSANAFLPVMPDRVGIVMMPHGATQPWNDAVEAVVAPLKSRYPVEMAYGMADPVTIRNAVARLETAGVRRIIFVRMYGLSEQMKAESDYILGLSDVLSTHVHGHDAAPPPDQLRSATTFHTFGGYEEDPALSTILLDRILEISRKPEEETVILVAHGAGEDKMDAQWRTVMNTHVARLRSSTLGKNFRAIRAITLREDWPEKREAAVAELANMIREGKGDGGRVLLISHRLHGAGPYRGLLTAAGIAEADYAFNGKGFAPHPVLTKWLERGIAQVASEMEGAQETAQVVVP
jgi:sirohydrochlorin ferrochelatase